MKKWEQIPSPKEGSTQLVYRRRQRSGPAGRNCYRIEIELRERAHRRDNG